MDVHSTYDVIIVGAGVSGSFMAQELSENGVRTLVLEAGSSFTRKTYPAKEIDANSKLYWGGGVELNTTATLALLRPKVVGGGSIVNQALMDRFDDVALDAFRDESGVSFLSTNGLAPWYDKAEQELAIQKVSEKYRNGNAEIFAEGFKKNGFHCAPLVRAQRDCHFEDGNDCITCLAGCPIDSKQSTPVTTLRKALKAGCSLISDFEVTHLSDHNGMKVVGGIWNHSQVAFKAKKIVMASGAIGNTRIFLQNRFQEKTPLIGERFYTHPQYMVIARYDREINAHRGPLQSYKSQDPNFRKKGFKLENVFAPPVAISMLLPQMGKAHLAKMKDITRMACIEVAVRDTHPGKVTLMKDGRPMVHKELNDEDRRRKSAGMEAIRSIFESTGAKEIIPGDLGIGLHLMGGCAIGVDGKTSVVSPEFHLHADRNIFAADSSIFPNAPGINPSLTIMALTKKAAQNVRATL